MFHVRVNNYFPGKKIYKPGEKVPDTHGEPTKYLCRYCRTYLPTAGALRLHVMKIRNTYCSNSNIPGKGRPNFYDWQIVKDFQCTKPSLTGGTCGSMFKSQKNLELHWASEHRYSKKTESISLDMADNINARKHLKRLQDRQAKEVQVQQGQPPPPPKKRRVSRSRSNTGKLSEFTK